MKYIKAQSIIPEEVIRIIQEYVDGEFIYIPRKDGKQRAWGEKSGARESLMERNKEIYRKYKDGATVDGLSKDYFLSEQSVRRIISEEKSKFSNSIHNHL